MKLVSRSNGAIVQCGVPLEYRLESSLIFIMKWTHCRLWSFARMYKSSKRKAPVLLCCIAVITLLFHWKLMCTSTQPNNKENLCASYVVGQSRASLCEALCHLQWSSISCLDWNLEKGVVFIGTWMNESINFKSVEASEGKVLSKLIHNKSVSFDQDVVDSIRKVVKTKFNIAITNRDAKIMSNSHVIGNGKTGKAPLWFLLNSNEFLALTLFDKYNVFPKLFGTCGPFYAVQKLDSISGYRHLVDLYDSHSEWVKRIKLSIMILDLLLKMEEIFSEPMLLCDIRMCNFGVTNDFKRVKYIKLDSVHPLSVANRITADGSSCKHHSDCDLSDCRSFCNLITNKCQHGVVNNNLQIVCEKIFLGWMMSGKVMVSGLLMGPRTPAVLVEILEKCANPFNENGTPRAPATKEIKKRLYNFLVHFI